MRRMHFTNRFYAIAFIALSLFLAVGVVYFQTSLRQGAARLAARTAQRDALVSEVGALQQAVEFAQTDAYVERTARDELGLIMPGEIRYVSN